MHTATKFISRFKFLMMISVMAAMLIILAGTSGALAQSAQGGFNNASTQGFTGPYADPITVKQAEELSDDAKVVLRGNIIKGLGGKLYTFRDSTGEIQVEISNKKWRGQQVGPDDTVDIYGEVEKDWGDPVRIDVSQIVKR